MSFKLFKKGEKMPAQDLVAALSQGDKSAGLGNAMLLLHDANTAGFGIDALLHQQVQGVNGLNGFEATFAALGVPLNLKDDTAIAAFASSTTSFMTNDGLKVLLPSLVITFYAHKILQGSLNVRKI